MFAKKLIMLTTGILICGYTSMTSTLRSIIDFITRQDRKEHLDLVGVDRIIPFMLSNAISSRTLKFQTIIPYKRHTILADRKAIYRIYGRFSENSKVHRSHIIKLLSDNLKYEEEKEDINYWNEELHRYLNRPL